MSPKDYSRFPKTFCNTVTAVCATLIQCVSNLDNKVEDAESCEDNKDDRHAHWQHDHHGDDMERAEDPAHQVVDYY